jgi:hypothetical protein
MFTHRIKSEGGAVNDTMPALTSHRQLRGFYAHLSAAPTTSENLTITLDSAAGSAYDVVVYKIDLSAASTTDVLYTDAKLPLMVGDAIRTTYTNTDARTIGITLIME